MVLRAELHCWLAWDSAAPHLLCLFFTIEKQLHWNIEAARTIYLIGRWPGYL